MLQQVSGSSGKQKTADIIIRPELDGIAALSFLWEQAAKIASRRDDNDDDDSSGITASSTIILALPDASPMLLRNFAEILEWMADFERPDSSLHAPPLLRASLIDTDNLNVPTLRLERKTSLKGLESLPLDAFSEVVDGNAADIVNTRTRRWVQRLLVEKGICPFTKSDRMSGQGLAEMGVPVGSIAYHASFHAHAIGLFADTWRAIHQMEEAGPSGKNGVSSILLAAPAFDDDFEYWAGPIFAMLEASVVAAQAESEIGVVCFHPKYATPDGKSWPGFGHMHSVPRLEKWYREYQDVAAKSSSRATTNAFITLSDLSTEQIAAGGAWQRRTPHATINVLRAKQLEIAESRRESTKMYAENIEKLVGINGAGSERLAEDLEAEQRIGT